MYHFNRALVRPPSRSVVDGLSATARDKPAFEGVAREHAAYVQALEAAGLTVETLPPLEAYPDSVFVEDTALVFSGAAIVLRPGAPTRRGEITEIAPTLERLFPRVMHLSEGFVDGGDVLATPRGIFIGESARTDAQGARALTALLAEIGLEGIAVATPHDVLHLKSDCALLDAETILVTARLAATGIFKAFRLIVVPPDEEAAANAVRINDHVLLSESHPRTGEQLARAGYTTVPLPTREIAKIDAGLSCMSLRWRG